MKKRFSFPKRYWIYMSMILVCAIMLIGNIYRTDSWTGDKPFSEFVYRDWMLFAVFLIEELIILLLMFMFAVLAGKISKKRNQEMVDAWELNKYVGIKPGDYVYVWFDFSRTERALILKQDKVYKLYVQAYDDHREDWENLNQVIIYDNLEELKKSLFFDFDFYCEENSVFDKNGDEIYISNKRFISSYPFKSKHKSG